MLRNSNYMAKRWADLSSPLILNLNWCRRIICQVENHFQELPSQVNSRPNTLTRNIDNGNNYDNNIKKVMVTTSKTTWWYFFDFSAASKTIVYTFYFIPQNGLQNNVISYNNQTKTSTKVKQPFRCIFPLDLCNRGIYRHLLSAWT